MISANGVGLPLLAQVARVRVSAGSPLLAQVVRVRVSAGSPLLAQVVRVVLVITRFYY